MGRVCDLELGTALQQEQCERLGIPPALPIILGRRKAPRLRQACARCVRAQPGCLGKVTDASPQPGSPHLPALPDPTKGGLAPRASVPAGQAWWARPLFPAPGRFLRIPPQGSRPNAAKRGRRRQAPTDATPRPHTSAGRARNLGRARGGVGSSGTVRGRARLPQGRGVRPGPRPRAPAGRGRRGARAAATKDASARPAAGPRPPPARGAPCARAPPCARAAARCHHRPRPAQTPRRAGRTEARPPPRAAAPAPAPPPRRRPRRSPEARPRRARTPSRTK